MAHYAKINNGRVEQVIVAEQDYIDSLSDSGSYIKTSYNTRGGVHYGQDGQPDGGDALRANFAGVGFLYDHINDVFVEPKPFASWTLNQSTWLWEAPTAHPDDGNHYSWNESTKSWVAI